MEIRSTQPAVLTMVYADSGDRGKIGLTGWIDAQTMLALDFSRPPLYTRLLKLGGWPSFLICPPALKLLKTLKVLALLRRC